MSKNILSSVQRRLLAEQEPGVLEKPEEEIDLEPEKGLTAHTAADEEHKAQRTIEAIKSLQDAAVGMESARFTIAREYRRTSSGYCCYTG